ncbi:MAG: hypothetical protein HRT57_06240 [Crocinitomicaceae bacterium]|nr:hypothetical protein [Crocinitomicaceae bacterium]
MKNFTNTKRTKIESSLKRALVFFSISLVSTSALFSQENRWETSPQGENPWASEESTTPETTSQDVKSTEHIEIVLSDTAKPLMTINGSVLSNEAKRTSVASKSTSTNRYFNFNGTEVMLNAKSFNYAKSLRHHGKSLHMGNGALAVGVITGSLINIYAAPVNLIASVIPTAQTTNEIRKFKKYNPHATAEEVRQVKKGINQKIIIKAMIGNGIGMVINIGVIAAIFLY